MKGKRKPCYRDSEDTNQPGGCKKLLEERTAGLHLKNQSGPMGVLIPFCQKMQVHDVKQLTRGWNLGPESLAWVYQWGHSGDRNHTRRLSRDNLI